VLSFGVFIEDDRLNVPRLSEQYFMSSMVNGDWIHPGSFVVHQLYSATTSTTGRVVIGGLITSIAYPLGVKHNLEDRLLDQSSLIKSPLNR